MTSATTAVSDPWAPGAPTKAWKAGTWPKVRIAAAAATGAIGVAAQAARETDSVPAGLALIAIGIAVAATLVHRPPRRLLQGAAYLVLVVGGAALLRTLVGGRQYVLVVVCTTLAAWALPTRRPAAEEPESRPTPFVIPVLVAAQVSWYRLAPQPVTAAMVAAAGILLLADLRRPGLLRRPEHLLFRALVRAAVAVGSLLLFLVAVLVLYLPALALRAVRAVMPGGTAAAEPQCWRPYLATSVDQRRDADRPFASTGRAVRRKRHRSSAVVVALTLIVAIAIVTDRPSARSGSDVPTFVAERTTPDTEPDPAAPPAPAGDGSGLFPEDGGVPYSERAPYLDVPWADALQAAELGGPSTPEAPFTSDEDGDRTTTQAPACSCTPVEIWFSGGSAAFGIGQRDDHTVASYLVQLAAADGLTLQVTNIAGTGLVMADEVARLEDRLADGAAPDLVIFYNGFNDALLDIALAFAETIDPERFDGDPIRAIEILKANLADFLDFDADDDVPRRTVERYRSLMDEADRLLDARGASSVHYFQPDALGSPLEVSWLAEGSGLEPDELVATALGVALDQAARGLEPDVRSLRGLFSAYPVPVFLDIVHQSEPGAALVAREIYLDLRPRLQALAD